MHACGGVPHLLAFARLVYPSGWAACAPLARGGEGCEPLPLLIISAALISPLAPPASLENPLKRKEVKYVPA